MDSIKLREAAEHWTNGQALRAGQLIYDSLPREARPRWAAGVLRLVLDKSRIQGPLFDSLLAAADDPDQWKGGHRLFSSLREQTLWLDQLGRMGQLSEKDEGYASVLGLAEFVAKVIYNATDPPDAFDEDSGWWIAAHLRSFVDHQWKDEGFAQAAWLALTSR